MDKIYKMLEELRPEFDFTNSADFIADGMIDSFDIISLVTNLEETYDILIDALDILPENFCSVDAIANLVCKNGATL